MQNRYAGDVGDFSKFSFLRALAGDDLRVGIVWYLNTSEEENRDGNYTDYSRLRKYTPTLYDILANVVNSRTRARSVAALEQAGVMPPGTLFYGSPLPVQRSTRDRSCVYRSRDHWLRGALRAMREADLVFLDPDNGVAPQTVSKYSRRSVKYAFPDEIVSFLRARHSIVLYQHHQRNPLDQTISANLENFRSLARTWALSFHVRSTRIY